MDLELKDRVTLITGGSRGIGLSIAEAFAKAGGHVAICGRDQDSLDHARTRLLEHGREVLTVRADVTEATEAEAVVDRCVTTFGRIDGLVNNVGGSVGSDILTSTDADWSATFERNLFQTIRMTRLVAPVMAAGGGGSITNIASISGWAPQLSGTLQYGTAKAALIYLTEPLALELARFGIRVNTVSPGSILWDGGGWQRYKAADATLFEAYVDGAFPAGRLGTTEEIGRVVAFLASPQASWINGRHIPVDGLQQPLPPPDRRLW